MSDFAKGRAAQRQTIKDQAAEIIRLRAWRDAINGYLTEAWSSPLRDDEAPLAALKRLIKLELTAMALDPEIHKAMNAAIATARRDALAEIKQDTDELIEQGRQDGMEQAAQRLEDLHKNHNYDPESGTLTRKLGRYDRWPESAKTAKFEHDAGYYRAIVEGVAHIRAAAGEGKPAPSDDRPSEEIIREDRDAWEVKP